MQSRCSTTEPCLLPILNKSLSLPALQHWQKTSSFGAPVPSSHLVGQWGDQWVEITCRVSVESSTQCDCFPSRFTLEVTLCCWNLPSPSEVFLWNIINWSLILNQQFTAPYLICVQCTDFWDAFVMVDLHKGKPLTEYLLYTCKQRRKKTHTCGLKALSSYWN